MLIKTFWEKMSTQPGFVIFMNSVVITIIETYSPFPLQREWWYGLFWVFASLQGNGLRLPWNHLGRSQLRRSIWSDEVAGVPLPVIVPPGSFGFMKMSAKACILTLRPQTFYLHRDSRDRMSQSTLFSFRDLFVQPQLSVILAYRSKDTCSSWPLTWTASC